ncbi:hypothetical protein MHLP_01755 [Candidatus Mycoplasma haematolamae str. Purdue]|uniref:Uncharacterized protein n=1 Tax=Mycoplasma haematolamae (strain Purdue) TaxID=1212765 RepID=I7CFE3_MYCHA|nr:hypothetical protein MHLP_01755 [Candidatus Mycoplasma haematolamae str. Purdue]
MTLGLVAGTSVSGCTHFVKNVHPRPDRTVAVRSEQKPQRDDLGAQSKTAVKEVDLQANERNTEHKEQEAATSLENQQDEIPEMESPPAEVDPEPKGPKVVVEDTRTSPVSDLLAPVPQRSPVKKKERYKQGTEQYPTIICVAEETGQREWKISGSSKTYKPTCIKKQDLEDYEKARVVSICERDVMDGLDSDLSNRLRYKDKSRCRYWDSWEGPKSNLMIQIDQIPQDFRV